MMTSAFDCTDIPDLRHRQLGAVVFEVDSVRLQFDGPELVFPGSFNISAGEGTFVLGAPGTRDLLRSWIAKRVLRVEQSLGARVDIVFDDGRTLTLTPEVVPPVRL